MPSSSVASRDVRFLPQLSSSQHVRIGGDVFGLMKHAEVTIDVFSCQLECSLNLITVTNANIHCTKRKQTVYPSSLGLVTLILMWEKSMMTAP